MGLLSFRLEFLATSLIGMALLFACIGRINDGGVRHFFWIPIWLLFSFFYVLCGLLAYGGCFLLGLFDRGWFYDEATMVVAFIGGSLWLAFRGLRRLDAEGRQTVAGARWSRRKLGGAFLIGLVVTLAGYGDLVLEAQQRSEAWRTEAERLELLAAPPAVAHQDNAAPFYYRICRELGEPDRENQSKQEEKEEQ